MSKNKKKEFEKSREEEPDLAGMYTAADLIKWPEDFAAELIRGKIFKMSPPPATDHQRVTGHIFYTFYNYFTPPNPCEVFCSPFGVYLVKPGEDWRESKNVVEPDVTVVCDKKKIKEKGCVGVPDFLVEVLSPSNRRKDLVIKTNLYKEHKVPEFWMIDPGKKKLIVHRLGDEGRYLVIHREKGEPFAPKRFPDLEVQWAGRP